MLLCLADASKSGTGARALGAFADIGVLTMFADYRIPVVLRQQGILRYSPALAEQVLSACRPLCTMSSVAPSA